MLKNFEINSHTCETQAQNYPVCWRCHLLQNRKGLQGQNENVYYASSEIICAFILNRSPVHDLQQNLWSMHQTDWPQLDTLYAALFSHVTFLVIVKNDKQTNTNCLSLYYWVL